MTQLKPLTYARIVGLTAVLWLTLYASMLARCEPVVLRAPPLELQGLTKEAYPYLSIAGSLLWLALVAIYAFAGGRLLASDPSLEGSPDPSRLAVGIFFISLIFLAVVHPNFLITLIQPDQRPDFVRFLEKDLPVLDRLYFHWGFQRYQLWLPLAHMVLVTFFILTYGIIRRTVAVTRR